MSSSLQTWTENSDVHLAAGFPAHHVKRFRSITSIIGPSTVTWQADCGLTGEHQGVRGAFSSSSSFRSFELCRACWPTGSPPVT